MIRTPISEADDALVFIPVPLRALTEGRDSVRVPGATVAQIFDALEQRFPGVRARLCDGDRLRPGVAVAVGTELATLGLLQSVPPGSEIHFLPAISGGLA
jgi:molybdopterin synthase sulfur carrier subunit